MLPRTVFALIIVFLTASACTTLTLKPAEYAWPIENALKVDAKGNITEPRYSFTLNVKPLFFEEFNDSTNYIGKEIRIIRDKAGYYFLTAKEFKSVYVFESVESGMKLENKITISETKGMASPAFNQKAPNIELLDAPSKYLLNYTGIMRQQK
ncbi:MAG: hypothetical protein FD143_2040 [Ignavibacteria bacterium]|nr:MAG: hypothetical protein FD143_2040 [Ignavibacteria bacterium]KAF0159106.1 MAG: hypothetical protein FD188_2269 [Ignavibacteria bacterium]